ncbi:50S ribosomal protein L18a [Candidatus Bathyarchaeota archaeon]|nr:50S ribosomal protein L18a [Candidatus Bathyarchaeota archaeon]
MSGVKVFRVTGEIHKPNLETSFNKEVIAAKPEHAVEKIYAELGSRHRAKRFQILIRNVEEIPVDDIKDSALKEMVLGEEKLGHGSSEES